MCVWVSTPASRASEVATHCRGNRCWISPLLPLRGPGGADGFLQVSGNLIWNAMYEITAALGDGWMDEAKNINCSSGGYVAEAKWKKIRSTLCKKDLAKK